MTDKEKVINGLECHLAITNDSLGTVHSCQDCSYSGELNCSTQLIANALELLKEQDAVEPIRSNESWYCGHCFERVGEMRAYANATGAAGIQKVRHKYCPECGRKVKWNETD